MLDTDCLEALVLEHWRCEPGFVYELDHIFVAALGPLVFRALQIWPEIEGSTPTPLQDDGPDGI